jgi:DNA polymerase
MDFLKNFTYWFSSKNKNKKYLEDLLKYYDIDKEILKRVLSYLYTYPHIIYFYNKYMNKLYDFNKFEVTDTIYSLVYLAESNHVGQRKLFYLKSSEYKEETKKEVCKLLKEYFQKIYDIDTNDEDLEMYYRLFNLGEIKEEELMKIDKLMNDKSTLKFERADFLEVEDLSKTENKTQEYVLTANLQLNTKMLDISNDIKNKALNREECKNCPMTGRPIVTFDTNLIEPGETSVVFIGLNPGKDEAIKDKPFVGDSGKDLRKDLIDQIHHNNLTWAIMNSIICSSANKNDIPEFDKVFNNCFQFRCDIAGKFPTKLYVPIGSDALKIFPKITETITAVSGKVFDFGTHKVIPLIHPSAVLRNRNAYTQLYKDSCANILKEIGINKTEDIPKAKQETKKEFVKQTSFTIPQDLMITQETEEHTLFDIKKLDYDNILMIFIDKDGNKRYLIKKFEVPVYIKNCEEKDLDMIGSDFDYVSYISGKNKFKFSKLIREKFDVMKSI